MPGQQNALLVDQKCTYHSTRCDLAVRASFADYLLHLAGNEAEYESYLFWKERSLAHKFAHKFFETTRQISGQAFHRPYGGLFPALSGM